MPSVPASDSHPVKEVLQTAIETTQVSTLAFAALDGASDCGRLVSGCAEPGCHFSLTIDASGACAAPIAPAGSGVVVVTGVRNGPDDATFAADFAGFDLSVNQPWFVLDVGTMVASRSGDRVTVVYAQQDVRVRDGVPSESAELTQHVWTAEEALAGTPGDTSDDTFTISGGAQGVAAGTSGASVMQAGIGSAVVTPACRKNPTSGTAVVEHIEVSTDGVLSLLSLGFHTACDGRADVVSAVGTQTFALDGTVPMDLSN